MIAKLCSFAELNAYLRLSDATVNENNISNYADLEVIRDSVKTAFEAFLGINLDFKEAESESFYTSSAFIPLTRLPIAKINSIIVGESELTSADYIIQNFSVRLLASSSTERKVIVNYDGGYTATNNILSVPLPIKRASLLQIASEYNNSMQVGSENLSTEAGTIQRPKLGLLDYVKELLIPYKHPFPNVMKIIL